MKEAGIPDQIPSADAASFIACLATILELPPDRLPHPAQGEDPATGWTFSRWLGGLGLGLVPVADPAQFAWPGPWIARVRPPGGSGGEDSGTGQNGGDGSGPGRRSVVMYGVPSGVVWDPAGGGPITGAWIEGAFLIAAADIALALPPRPLPPAGAGTVEGIWVAPAAGEAAQPATAVHAIAGRGLDGDRHVNGTGTFPSGLPGSALTLIEAEVCESFDPPLGADEHRRNVVTRGIGLNGLAGREFTIGPVRCRGMRLCEPCMVIQRRSPRQLLRPLVHRGGLRADIITDGVIRVGDQIAIAEPPEPGDRAPFHRTGPAC
jgi:hypothetical protein